MMPKKILLSLVGVLLLCDVGLFVSGKKLLVHSEVERTVVYQGDIVLLATPERVGPDYSKPINSAYCTYWNGIRLTRPGGLRKCPGPIV
jgi:hypothetical protein